MNSRENIEYTSSPLDYIEYTSSLLNYSPTANHLQSWYIMVSTYTSISILPYLHIHRKQRFPTLKSQHHLQLIKRSTFECISRQFFDKSCKNKSKVKSPEGKQKDRDWEEIMKLNIKLDNLVTETDLKVKSITKKSNSSLKI